MAWTPASARPHWAASCGRTAAKSSSRRILRAMVSPATRSTTNHDSPSAVPVSPLPSALASVATTAGTGTPVAAAVAGAALVAPPGEPFVDDGVAVARLVGQAVHPQDVAPELVDPVALVGGAHVAHAVGHAVVGQLAGHVPVADRRRLAVAPYPAAVQVAGRRADADAAEVHVVAHVDREPAPHLRAAPAAGAPRLVAVAAGRRGVEPPGLAVTADRPRPAPGLLEMALAHGGGGRRGGGLTSGPPPPPAR